MPDRLCDVALLVPDVPAPDGTRDTAEPVVIFEDRSIFTDLAPDEGWIASAPVVQKRRMVDEILTHDMPAYRRADYDFLARLEANYLPTSAVGHPGGPFGQPSPILAGRQDSTVGYQAAWGLMDEFPRATYAALDMAGHQLGRIERPRPFPG